MKKLLALLVTSLIVLTSMSDCKKNIDLNLVGGVEEILISVDINGLTYETTEFKINPMYLRKRLRSYVLQHKPRKLFV